ncbi:phosphoenolpyruvate--protein phosphotransferase [Candidatus Berkiella aquae]|uniref:phosphoenolpyruvate--protein phosphotransferase n=1 Tax=Candidatus Berkiella aquae TaxID=295108 RepID=A0A0Q9YZ00_9GAMM|nr:phosphoenolpyruvate--protein phosphotransferase [Candidatus Berkiella aquae]MCS5712555.1 phosphoenolpyruvate--protein phosphotransferase [Candidatus Berkiella aquae]
MLSVLRQIVQEVNEAQDLQEVLRIIVERVSCAMGVEACSAYLVERRKHHYLLVASVGFLDGVDGKVTIPLSEGLVGLVGEREEPINLSDAPSHPRYRYFPETGEERYSAFLGVPMIHQRRVVGILVIQQRQPRRFDEGEVAFLVTVSAQLASYIAHANAGGVMTHFTVTQSNLPSTLHGIPSAPGIAIGTAVLVLPADLDAVTDKEITDIDREIEYFEQALETTRADIRRLKGHLAKTLLPEEQNLFDAYLSMLDSRSIKEDIIALIEEGHWAPYALRKIIKRQVHKFETMEDPYLRERSADLLDLGRRVLANLQSESPLPHTYPHDTILVGDEISASDLAEVPQDHLLGIVSLKGSANSHVAILARAIGIPAVMGVAGFPAHKCDRKQIIVDGYHGEVFTSPTQAMISDFARLAAEEKELYAGLDELRELRCETPDGTRVALCVNAGLVADIRPALQVGAEGVGLYRTEVPFMIRDRFPSEEEQYLIYRQLLESFAPKPVTIRTLDVGGDKFLSYFPVTEDNPFLGWRGIRITLDHPEIFLVQLRAMLRASNGLQNLRVLFPMISCISEIEEALRLLRQAHREVIDEGGNARFPETGVMIEVPSAVYQAHELIKRVDFLSVGSNDLTQYLLAVDRNNPYVANLYDSLHPAVLHALAIIANAAHSQNKPVAICGEMASEPTAVIALLGLGYNQLSMNALSLPRVKWIIRNFTVVKAQQLVKEVMNFHHAQDIRQFLESALEDAGLGGLVRGGK